MSFSDHENLIKFPKIREEKELHNVHFVDNYSWLRDPNWPKVDSKEILLHLERENNCINSYLQKYSKQNKQILKELRGRVVETYQTPYTKHGEYYYYIRFVAGEEHGVFCRKNGSETAEEEMILNVNDLAKNHNFTRINATALSPDNRYFAYSVDHTGAERYTVHVLDMRERNKLLLDKIDSTIGGIAWHEELYGFFYSKLNAQWKPDKVFFHEIGQDSSKDKLIYEETDAKFSVYPCKSSSRKYIFLSVHGHNSSEFLCIDVRNSKILPKVILPRKEGVIYDAEHHGDHFYLRINDCSPNFRLAKLPIVHLGEKFDLTDYEKEAEHLYLKSFDVTERYMILNYTNKGIPLIRVREMTDESTKTLKFDDIAYSGYAYCSHFNDNDIRVNYSSLACPATVFRYDFLKDQLTILRKDELKEFDSTKYCVQRLEANNGDVKIPITVLFNKSYGISSDRPLYMTGYGSYGYGMSPSFSNSAISIVDRGFTFAIAHVRGGDELGYQWYTSGKFFQKHNTFDDFIACTEQLVKLGYTTSGNIAIMSASAGGMLVGNVINQRPELYKCAVAEVPFVDVLNTMLDSSLPLTVGEYEEWGDPNLIEYFRSIFSYCPYQNIKSSEYPHVLATAGISDPRVGYWEAAKWIAKIREFNTAGSYAFLKTDMTSGHSGASGRFKALEELADVLTFICSIMLKDFENS